MKKSIYSCPGKDTVPTPREFANLDWLATLIYHRPNVSNLRTDSSFSSEGDHKLSKEEGEKRADFSEGDDVEDSEDDGLRNKDVESSFSGDLQLEVKTTRLKETGSQEKAEKLHTHLALR